MICFTIALRSKESTNNWNDVLENFENTLYSIFNQTDSNFRVYVGCNEIPNLTRMYDDRLRFVTANLPVPSTWEERCRDRSWKLLLCAKEIRKDIKELSTPDGGIFVFPVDADDFINNKIVEYVNRHPKANGFKSQDGYCWRKGSKYVVITKYYGGTMNIMKMYEDDLPDELPDQSLCFDKETAMKLTNRYPIRWYDIEVEKKFLERGKPFKRLPFRSTIYVVGTGENISNDDPDNKISNNRFHPVAFLRTINPLDKRILSSKMKKEFGIVK